MENNIINISEGYKAVVLPKDARSIFCENTNSYGPKKLCYWDGFHSIYVDLKLDPDSRFELIGALNNLTEDQAREIMEGSNYETWRTFRNYKHMLISFIESLGIKTENPLKKPDDEIYSVGMHFAKAKAVHKAKMELWEASERDCKRIVIIKTK